MTSGTAQAFDNDPFAIREKRPSLKFPTPGTIRQGVVVDITPDVQSRDPNTGELDVWKKSNTPVLNIVIDLDTDEGPQSFWVTKYVKDAKFQAMSQAQQELGRPIQKGDTLKVAYTGDDPATAGSPLPRKLYKVKIEPAAVGSTADPFATPAQSPDTVPF